MKEHAAIPSQKTDFGNRSNDDSSTVYVAPEPPTRCVSEIIKQRGFDQLVLKGAGHSQNCSTLALRPGLTKLNLVVDQCDAPADYLEFDAERSLLTASSRLTWLQLERYANKFGHSIPVLTDVLDTSVGGTLSVGGGYGSRSICHGAQFSHLHRLRFLDAMGIEGEIDVAASHIPESRFVGRLGRDGVITSVTMKVMRMKPAMIRFSCLYRSLSAQLDHLEHLLDDSKFASSVDHCELRFRPFNSQLCQTAFAFEVDGAASDSPVVHHAEKVLGSHVYKQRRLPIAPYLLKKMDNARKLVGLMPPYRVWCDFSLPDLKALKSFLEQAFASFDFDVAYGIPVRIDAGHTQKFSSTSVYRRGAQANSYGFGAGLYRFFNDPRIADKAVDDVGELYSLARSLSGYPYLYGAFPSWVLAEHFEASSKRVDTHLAAGEAGNQ